MKENFIHVSQVNDNECGIACISMILKYFDIDMDYSEIRDNLNLTKDGLIIKDMLDFLKKFDIRTRIFKMTKEHFYNFNKFKMKLSVPVIAVIEEKTSLHYIIIYKIKKGKMLYSDPVNEKVVEEKNINLFNKIRFFIIPEKSKYKRVIRISNNFIISNVMKRKKEILKITLITFLSSIISVIVSTNAGTFINTLDIESNGIFYSTITYLVIFYILLYMSMIFISRVQSKISLYTIKNIEKDISYDLVNNILNQSYSDFKNYNLGEITTRINDCVSVSMTIAYFILTILSDFTIGIFAIIFLSFIEVRLIVILIISLLLNSLITHFTYKIVFEMEHKNIKIYSKYYGMLVEMINGFETINTISSEKFHRRKLNDILEEYRDNSLYKENFLNKISLFQNMINFLGTIFLIFAGVQYVRLGYISIGNLATYSTFSGILTSIVGRLINFQFDLENFIISYNRIIQMFRNNNKKLDGKIDVGIITSIDINNLCISYNNNIVLKNVSLSINNKRTIIRGNSGSGKSSFAKIISGLDNHYSGNILINNKYNIKDIKKLPITYLSNNSAIFEGTLRDNLCQGINVLDEHLLSLCKEFCLNDLIIKNPEGLDYIIQPNNSNLSTGEKQRIALIRAILTEPSLLILDEALSNIDDTNKKIIMNNLCKYSFKIILITHDNLTFPDCSELLFIDQGVIEQ